MSQFERITSKDNDIIKKAAQLVSSSKARRENRQFVLDGQRLCMDAAQNGYPIDIFIVGETAYNKFSSDADYLSKMAERSYIVPDLLINKISDTVRPQGFIAVCSFKDMSAFEFRNDGLYLGLENLADPANLGAVSRSAEALGFDALVVTDNGCDIYNSKALRASMGALLRIPVITVGNMSEFVRDCGLISYACVLDKNASDIRSVNFRRGSVALIGNEANGLTEETVLASSEAVTIPMPGKAESLNASIAAAIVMWEMSCKS